MAPLPFVWESFLHDPATRAQFQQLNSAYLTSPEGSDLWAQFQQLRNRWFAIEHNIGNHPARATQLRQEQMQLKSQFQALRSRIQQSPNNPVNPAYVPPAGPTAAASAPPISTAPPVYLPTVNSPQYRFPSAENVRDMTYDPGIGGFLRPNQWQPGVPASPYTPGVPMQSPQQPFSYGPQMPMMGQGSGQTGSQLLGGLQAQPQPFQPQQPAQGQPLFPWMMH